MRQRLSWVEVLAVALVSIGVVLFLMQGVIAGFAPAPAASWLDLRSAGLEILAIFGAVLCVAAGLSLLIVRPLMALGPRAPFWLISVVGIAVLVWRDSACRALNPGDIRSLSNSMPD